MKREKKGKDWSEEELGIPNWLRIALIVLAILSLITIMRKAGPQRTDFPFFRRM